MLNGIETRIMEYLFTRCRGKRTVLIPHDDILKNIAMGKNGRVLTHYEITRKQLDTYMKSLILEGYVDYSLTNDKNGNMLYVVTLTTRGEAFQRERDDKIKRRWREVGWRILLAVAAGGVSYIVYALIGKK